MSRVIDRLLFWRGPRIAVVELHGILASRLGALNLKSAGPVLKAAFAGTAREGHLILDINSPGGSPVQSQLIADLIRREAEAKAVHVHAVIQDIGASGGYWLACAADSIQANAMSVVGSIGVVGGGFGFAELIGRHGIERRLYTAGENKARLDPFSPERPDDVAFVRQLMADIHDRFKDWVRSRRGARLTAPEERIFDGSFCLGSQALASGLIDGLGDVETLVQTLGGEKARARLFRPQRRRGLLRLLPGMAARSVVEAALDAAEERAGPQLRA